VFGLGVGEILLVLIVVLVVFGPTKLPDLARTMGKAMAEFRRASRDLKETFEYELYKMDESQQRQGGQPPKVLEAQVEDASPAPAALPRQPAPAHLPSSSPAQPPASAPPPEADPGQQAAGTEPPPPEPPGRHG
jgi:sec-independent protein translocase protein TatB